jgi:hypothetical protein
MLRALTRTRRLISATLLVMIALAGCAPTPAAPAIEATAPNVQPKASESQSSSLTGFGFPTSIDPGSRYLFYLHGQIVEDQGLAAVSPQFGAYEYEAILRSLQRTGLTVISELRTRNTSPSTYTAACRPGTLPWWAPPRAPILRRCLHT